MTIFDRVVEWSKERGIIPTKKYDYRQEVGFIIEELLESTGKHNSKSASKELDKVLDYMEIDQPGTPEEIVDAFGDIIVFASGGIAKLGYDPNKVMDEVLKEIESRTGKIINGRFVKDTDVKMYKADFEKCKY